MWTVLSKLSRSSAHRFQIIADVSLSILNTTDQTRAVAFAALPLPEAGKLLS